MFIVSNHDFGPGKLVLLGGVQINMPDGYEDQFEPLCFQEGPAAEGVSLSAIRRRIRRIRIIFQEGPAAKGNSLSAREHTQSPARKVKLLVEILRTYFEDAPNQHLVSCCLLARPRFRGG